MKPNIKRLKKLANHLLKPLPEGREFTFNEWTKIERDSDFNICKTCACAQGECPVIWPSLIKIKDISGDYERFEVVLKRGSTSYSKYDAKIFFNLTEEQGNFLFLPSEQLKRSDGEREDLGRNSSAKDVAENILWFIDNFELYTFEESDTWMGFDGDE